MIRALIQRFRQKHRTVAYPAQPPTVPDRLRGRPELAPEKCPADCAQCLAACPVGALTCGKNGLRIDLGQCLFCGDCATACPHGAIRFSRDHRLATRQREDLVLGAGELKRAAALDAKMKSLFGRSLRLRQVSAGGCGA